MTRSGLALVCLALWCCSSVAEESRAETEMWEKRYQQLLKDRPEIRRKVDSGGATKQQVIEWLKQGGDKKPAQRKYYGRKIEVKAPASFRPKGGEVIYSGPQPGEKLPPLNVVGISGSRKNEDYDPVALAEGGPHVLIFQDTDEATLKGLYFLGPVLDRIQEKSGSDLQVSVVLLADDRSDLRSREIEFYQEAGKCFELSHSLDGREGPGTYGLNRFVDVTIVVAKDGRVVRNFAFPAPVFAADPHVLGAVAEILGQDRLTVASWFKDAE